MSSGQDQHNRAIARRAFKLKQQGLTSRQIADAIGKKPEQVKGLVSLGQRLIESEVQAPATAPARTE